MELQRCRGLEEFNLRIRQILRMHVDIFAHLPGDTVDGGMDAQSFADDGIQKREVLDLLVLHGTPGAIRVAEVLDLLLVKRFTARLVSNKTHL